MLRNVLGEVAVPAGANSQNYYVCLYYPAFICDTMVERALLIW